MAALQQLRRARRRGGGQHAVAGQAELAEGLGLDPLVADLARERERELGVMLRAGIVALELQGAGPKTWALLLAGLGPAGMLARRQRKT